MLSSTQGSQSHLLFCRVDFSQENMKPRRCFSSESLLSGQTNFCTLDQLFNQDETSTLD